MYIYKTHTTTTTLQLHDSYQIKLDMYLKNLTLCKICPDYDSFKVHLL